MEPRKPKSELDQLHSLGDAKFGRRSGIPVSASRAGPRDAPPIERTAALSHRANDAYMEEFERGFAALQQQAAARSGSSAAAAASGVVRSHTTVQVLPDGDGGGGMAGRGASGSAAAATARPRMSVGGTARSRSGTTVAATGGSGRGPSSFSSAAATASASASASASAVLPSPQLRFSPQWLRGPLDPAGRLIDLSDRVIVSAAINSRTGEALLACTDHAAYAVDLARGAKSRHLYGGKYGHSEWLTGVCWLGDGSGRALTAAMDGKVCLWNSAPTGRQWMCSDLLGHFGSVTTVLSPGGGTAACGPPSAAAARYAVSVGYDKSLRLWDCTAGGACVFTSKQHAAPIVCGALHANGGAGEFHALTGDREGCVRLWDLHACKALGQLAGHKGHITALAFLNTTGDPVLSSSGSGGYAGDDGGAAAASSVASPSALPVGSTFLILTGAQDGHVRVWDPRASPTAAACVANLPLHTSDQGSGAVGDICPTTISGSGGSSSGGSGGGSSETVVVTAGADRQLAVVDPRAGWRERYRFTQHRDFVYSLHTAGNLCFSGGGDGILLTHDLSTGKLLWGLGANAAAVRCIGTLGSQLIVSGDDGKALVYDF